MDSRLNLPESFVRTIVDVYGDEGVTWLDQLPALLTSCERRWNICVLPCFPNLSYNFVAPAVRADGTPVVLKAGVPGDHLTTEMNTLRVFDGRGCARLLDHDPEQGLILLERLKPGTLLSDLDDDDQAMAIAAGVMRLLWRPMSREHGFRTVSSWWGSSLRNLRAEFGGSGPFPERLVALTEAIYADADAATADPVMLHGDLHQGNILADGAGSWRAIDPHGLVGDRAHEVGSLLYNGIEETSDLRRVLARRLDLLAAELALERRRLVLCGLAKAMLSAWWSYEDHGHGWEHALAVAEALDEML